MISSYFYWVVGIWSIIYPQPVTVVQRFLYMPQKHWKAVIDKTVLASVSAFYFLYLVRFGGLYTQTHPTRGMEGSDCEEQDLETRSARGGSTRRTVTGKTSVRLVH